MADANYIPVRETLPSTLPSITQKEALKYARKLYPKFCVRDSGASMSLPNKARRCWASTKPTSGSNQFKGWGRLIHDISHIAFRFNYPLKRPHDTLHARYELNVADYVVRAGWLTGKPEAKPRDVKAERYAQAQANLKAWESKAKRAATGVKKWRAKVRYYERQGLTPCI